MIRSLSGLAQMRGGRSCAGRDRSWSITRARTLSMDLSRPHSCDCSIIGCSPLGVSYRMMQSLWRRQSTLTSSKTVCQTKCPDQSKIDIINRRHSRRDILSQPGEVVFQPAGLQVLWLLQRSHTSCPQRHHRPQLQSQSYAPTYTRRRRSPPIAEGLVTRARDGVGTLRSAHRTSERGLATRSALLHLCRYLRSALIRPSHPRVHPTSVRCPPQTGMDPIHNVAHVHVGCARHATGPPRDS